MRLSNKILDLGLAPFSAKRLRTTGADRTIFIANLYFTSDCDSSFHSQKHDYRNTWAFQLCFHLRSVSPSIPSLVFVPLLEQVTLVSLMVILKNRPRSVAEVGLAATDSARKNNKDQHLLRAPLKNGLKAKFAAVFNFSLNVGRVFCAMSKFSCC